MNLQQAAQLLDIHQRTVRRRLLVGKLRARRDGKRWIIEPEEIERYKREECRHYGPPVAAPAQFKCFPQLNGRVVRCKCTK